MNKGIWKIDLAIVLISVFVLLGVVGYSRPLVIAPIDGLTSSDSEILFEFERADVLLIDDNKEFSSPEEYDVSGSEKIILDGGVYYWKVRGFLGSEVRKLTIESRVELMLVERDEGVVVVNMGNVGLNVDVYDDGEFVERKSVGIGEGISGGDKFVGRENG